MPRATRALTGSQASKPTGSCPPVRCARWPMLESRSFRNIIDIEKFRSKYTGHQAGYMTPPIRILALNWRCTNHPQAGGAEMNLFEQARRWAREGHEVTVFCSDPGREH